MRCAALLLLGLGLVSSAVCASLPPCSQGAKTFEVCQLQFDWQPGELAAGTSPYRDELLSVEFRSPRHRTFLMRAFWPGGNALTVRFSPTEPGTWTYHVTSKIARYNDKETTFEAADSGLPGFVAVANVRHWWTSNKQPHLWLSASTSFLNMDHGAYQSWLDARKHDGFTHVRGTLLTQTGTLKPLRADGTPNEQYYSQLDDALIEADQRGFALDLVLADAAFAQSSSFRDWDSWSPLLRYLVARYGAMNVTWQGIGHFESVPGARALLKSLNEALGKYDSYNHPRSTDARDSSSPLLQDGWMNYLMEASPRPELGAVEHQFTAVPEIHIIQATEPDAFRRELWNCTTNGEYPTVSFAALQSEANIKAVQVWSKLMADTRHWEFEPYFDVDGARATGLNEVEYLAYAEKPGIVEITLPKHKYNPVWVNPITGEELELKDYKGEVFSRQTPDSLHDWILQVPREGHKESMLKSYRFESVDAPIQEPELDPALTPFTIVDPAGDTLNTVIPVPFAVKITRANRATRLMQYVWWGEVVASGAGARLLATGASGTLAVPPTLLKQPAQNLNVRLLAINANGKAYEVDRVYRLAP